MARSSRSRFDFPLLYLQVGAVRWGQKLPELTAFISIKALSPNNRLPGLFCQSICQIDHKNKTACHVLTFKFLCLSRFKLLTQRAPTYISNTHIWQDESGFFLSAAIIVNEYQLLESLEVAVQSQWAMPLLWYYIGPQLPLTNVWYQLLTHSTSGGLKKKKKNVSEPAFHYCVWNCTGRYQFRTGPALGDLEEVPQ